VKDLSSRAPSFGRVWPTSHCLMPAMAWQMLLNARYRPQSQSQAQSQNSCSCFSLRIGETGFPVLVVGVFGGFSVSVLVLGVFDGFSVPVLVVGVFGGFSVSMGALADKCWLAVTFVCVFLRELYV
jgi:hypothetical protein